MMIAAHRGASGVAPENTLASFELAWRKNADAIEGDFRLTKDGVIVCIHDDNTERTGNKKLVIAESTLQELREIDIGSYRGSQFSGERIATLEQVINTIPNGKKILIEIKCGSQIVPILIDQLDQSKLKTDQIIIISYDTHVISVCKSLAPQYQANWIYDFVEDCDIDNVTSTLLEINANGLSSNNENSKALVDAVLALGLSYHTGWSITDEGWAQRMLDWGAASLTTNNPEKIRRKLTK
jgi:glycerophosphoryl diester phosphodiesterase